jgi:hypothetical protein
MNTEYVVIGGLLIILSGVQVWLRFGPWAKEIQAEERELAKRRAAAAISAGDGESDLESESGAVRTKPGGPVPAERGSKLWSKWTSALGSIGMVLGLFLLFWGIFHG